MVSTGGRLAPTHHFFFVDQLRGFSGSFGSHVTSLASSRRAPFSASTMPLPPVGERETSVVCDRVRTAAATSASASRARTRPVGEVSW